MGRPGYINLDKYLVHTAVLAVTGIGTFGDTVVTTSATVPCLYYQDSASRNMLGNGKLELQYMHKLLLPSSVVVAVNDQITNVVNAEGDALVSSARIVKVESFQGWKPGRGTVARECVLEVN